MRCVDSSAGEQAGPWHILIESEHSVALKLDRAVPVSEAVVWQPQRLQTNRESISREEAGSRQRFNHCHF